MRAQIDELKSQLRRAEAAAKEEQKRASAIERRALKAEKAHARLRKKEEEDTNQLNDVVQVSACLLTSFFLCCINHRKVLANKHVCHAVRRPLSIISCLLQQERTKQRLECWNWRSSSQTAHVEKEALRMVGLQFNSILFFLTAQPLF